MQIRQQYKIHTQTIYIDKFIRLGEKKIVSLGRDINLNTQEDMGYVVKVWDFSSFVQDGKSDKSNHLTNSIHTCWAIGSHWWIPQRRGWCSGIDESDARDACVGWRDSSEDVQVGAFN